jgi:hypothetical protein
MLRTVALAVTSLVLAMPALAQKGGGSERIIVTASAIRRDNSDIPYQSIRVRADFIVFLLTLETGTRSVDERAKELDQTFRSLRERAARVQGVTIEVGEDGEYAPVETTAIREIIRPDYDDEERSVIPLALVIDVRPDETFQQVRERVERLIAETRMAGRVEAIIGDEQSIGLSNPKAHRDALMKAIADETLQVQGLFSRNPAAPASVSVTNLHSRVLSRPVGALELELYIPYEMHLISGPVR